MSIEVLPLGAGQDVGRSCCVVRMAGRTVMFDCGAHFGFKDARRFPEFGLLSRAGRFTDIIDAVVITHFHTDHLGALPYFTEVCGYRGPILMTYPTFAIAPIILDDYVKVNADRPGERLPYNEQHVRDCLRRVTAVDLHQVVSVAPGLSFTFHFAGHVLGAAMVHLRAGHLTAVYTGDFNSSPDRHLGPAELLMPAGGPAGAPWRRPDVLISEATYAASLRDSKRGRERDLLTAVVNTVAAGGKVLIPTFAMGRAQELLMLIVDCWERNGLQVPIYFSSAMASRALVYYQLLLNWTNANVRRSIFGGSTAMSAASAGSPTPPEAASRRRRYYHCYDDTQADAVAAPGASSGASPGTRLRGGPDERTASVPQTTSWSADEEDDDDDDDEEEEEEEEEGEDSERFLNDSVDGSVRCGCDGGGGEAGPGLGSAAKAAAAAAVRQQRWRRARSRRVLPPDIKLDGSSGDDSGGGDGQGRGGDGGSGGPPPPRSVGVFSEADVYGMFRTLPWDRSLLHAPGPALLFASPGNITSGISLEAFRAWAGSPKNLLVLAGYQVRGTLGARLEAIQNQQQGQQGRKGDAAPSVDVPNTAAAAVAGGGSSKVEVRCRVKMLAFSAHADLRGILGLVRRCQPRAVVLVHGQREPMEFLRGRISATQGIECHAPPTGTTVTITPRREVPLGVRPQLLATAAAAAGVLAAQAAAAAAGAAGSVDRGLSSLAWSHDQEHDQGHGQGQECWGGLPAARMVPQPLTALPLSGIVVARVVAAQSQQPQLQPQQPQLQPQLQPQQLLGQALQGAGPALAGGGDASGAGGGTGGGGPAATQLTLTDAATASRVLLEVHNTAAAVASSSSVELHQRQQPVVPFKITFGCTLHVRLGGRPHRRQQCDQRHVDASDGIGGVGAAASVPQVDVAEKGQQPAPMVACPATTAVAALRAAHMAVCTAAGGYAASKRLRLDEMALTLTLGSFRARLVLIPEPPRSQDGEATVASSEGDEMCVGGVPSAHGTGPDGEHGGSGVGAGAGKGLEAAAGRFECEWAAADEAVAARCLQALRSAFTAAHP